MTELRELQVRQRRLLRIWLDEMDGKERFEILRELRTVERELAELARTVEVANETIQTFAVSNVQYQ